MTLSTLTSRVSYPGAGSVGPFAIPFKFLSSADLLVMKRSAAGAESTLGLTADYTVTGAGEVTGTLTLLTALAAGETLVIRRKPPLTQPTSIRNQGAYFPATIEDEFDRLAMQLQALQDSVDRSLKMPETLPGSAALTELAPTVGMVPVGTGTGFTMAPLDAGSVALPGGGRTVTTLTAYLANNSVYHVKDFGALGTGLLSDDTVAFQATVDAMPSYPFGAGVMDCSGAPDFWRITDTIHFGRFSVSGNNNVNGFSFSKPGLEVHLGGSIVQWDGADQPGTTKVVKTDTVGNYDLITDDKPMFSVVACNGFTIRQGTLKGLSPNALKQAHSHIWFQGNHNIHRFDNVEAYGARIGVRHGCAWDHALGVQYWGYADSPYYKANVYDAPAVGGWQGDSQSYTACGFAGTLAHYSTESAQNLSISFNAVSMGEGVTTATYGIVMVGGRITANGLSINRASTYDVWMPTGSNSFTAIDLHSESAAAVKIRTSTVAAAPIINLINSDHGNITLAGGGGQVTLIGCGNVAIVRSNVAARADIYVANSTIASFAVTNTGARENLNVVLRNCTLSAAILAGATSANCYLDAHNCTPIANLPAQSGSFSTTHESFNGQTHTVKNKIAVPHNATTLLGTISTDVAGASSTGTCELRVNFSTAASVNIASVFGLYSFAWTRDSGNAITLSAVAVINEAKALDGIAAFTVTITVALSGTDIQINALQTNTPAVAAVAELQGEIYEGGNYVTAQTPLWTPA